jgi:hypothetical protein
VTGAIAADCCNCHCGTGRTATQHNTAAQYTPWGGSFWIDQGQPGWLAGRVGGSYYRPGSLSPLHGTEAAFCCAAVKSSSTGHTR